MKLSVLIPVYNERDGVEELLSRVVDVDLEKEIIVVDDCSTDGTTQILEGLEEMPDLRLIRHDRNAGKGAAIRTAMSAASGDVVVIQDADLEYDPGEFVRLLHPIERGDASVVYGVRDLSDQKPLLHWGNRLLTWVTNVLYGTDLKDMETCYKMMRAEVAEGLNIESDRFDIEPEITAKIVKAGYRIHQVPISYEPREEKKLSPWRDGLPALWTLIKHRFFES